MPLTSCPWATPYRLNGLLDRLVAMGILAHVDDLHFADPVSYTHLTLPTIYSV